MSSLPLVETPFESTTVELKDIIGLNNPEYSDRDDIPIIIFAIFCVLFIAQTVAFGIIFYGLYTGFFDEKFFRPKSKIPFFSSLHQEIEQEYEKPNPPPSREEHQQQQPAAAAEKTAEQK